MNKVKCYPLATVVARQDGEAIAVSGEPTANPHLVVTPNLNEDGRFTGGFALTHTPTGRALTNGLVETLRAIADQLTDLDWSFTDVKSASKPTLETARTVIRDLMFTDPSTVDLPAHPGWGPDGEGKGIPRGAVPLARNMLAATRFAGKRTIGPDAVPINVPDPDAPNGRKQNPEWHHWVMRHVDTFGLAYLLLALHQLDAAAADSVAAWLADQWHAGDSLGEWAYEWAQALIAGESLMVPGLPVYGPLLGDPQPADGEDDDG